MNLNGGRPIKERPQSPVIFESQKFVRARIERRWLMLFKQTAEFLERQKPRTAGVPELVEDIMLKRRLQRSEAAWKVNILFLCGIVFRMKLRRVLWKSHDKISGHAVVSQSFHD